jgi:hypothetical protein
LNFLLFLHLIEQIIIDLSLMQYLISDLVMSSPFLVLYFIHLLPRLLLSFLLFQIVYLISYLHLLNLKLLLLQLGLYLIHNPLLF